MAFRNLQLLRPTMTAVSCLSMLCSPLLGVEPKQSRPVPVLALDVMLGAEGTLHGELRDRQGRPQADVAVTLSSRSQVIQQAQTDRLGRFRFAGQRVGVYRISAPGVSVTCRAWTTAIAPPAARARLLLVVQGVSARGQQPLTEVFVANPFLMGTVIAAAIAIPIAVHNSGDEDVPDGS